MAVLVVCPQLIGGAPAWAVVTCAGFAGAALMAVLRETRGQPAGTSGIAPLMLLALLWTGLQALPLPCDLVGWIAPDSVRHYQRALALIEQPAAHLCSLSRDPGSTHAEIVKGCAIVCAYLAASLLARAGQGATVLMAVALASGVMAAVALGHVALGAERVFGLYTRETELKLLAPIINPNNLAGFIAMGIPLMLALWERRAGGDARPAWLAGALLSILIVLLTRSRGGIAVMVIGVVGYLGISQLRRRSRSRRETGLRTQALTVLSVALALGLGVYATFDSLAEEVRTGDLSKLELIRAGAEFALRQPLVGVGRGAFSAAFVAHVGTTRRYEYAENFPVQWASEWGLPIACILLIGLARAFAGASRRTSDSLRVAGLLGLGCIALQNQVDLGFELVGIAIGVAALTATVLDERAPEIGWIGFDLRRMASATLGLTVLAVLGLGLTLEHNDPRSALRELAYMQDAGERGAFQAKLSEAMALHPSEPNLTLAASVEATEAVDPNAGKWINRTMELAPHWAEPHALAAAWLWYMGRRDQAVIELKETAARDMVHAGPLGCRIAQVAPDMALAATPTAATRAAYLERIARCAPNDSAAALEADQLLIRENPSNPKPRVRLVQRLMRQGKLDEAIREAQALASSHPDETQAQLGLASALQAAGRIDDAIRVCNDAVASVDDPFAIVMLRMRIEAESKRLDAMRQSAQQLRRIAVGDAERLALALASLARHEAQNNNLLSALKAAQEAQRVQPDRNRLRLVASLLRKIGDRASLYRVLSEICAIERDAAACRERDALRAPKVRP